MQAVHYRVGRCTKSPLRSEHEAAMKGGPLCNADLIGVRESAHGGMAA